MLNNLFANKRIMIVVAHPDDELLGLGATMNKLILEYGVITHVVILGEGITSRSNKRDLEQWNDVLITHRKNIYLAQREIGYGSVSVYDFPDNRFDSVSLLDLIKVVESEKQKFNPDIIFTHHGGDLNIDHQRTFESVMTACRPMQNENVKAIITFETPSGTEWRASSDPNHFLPNLLIAVTRKNIETKIKAMNLYEYEKREYPHPRSGEALLVISKNRGISVGVDYAEAFQIIRLIL